MSTWSFKYLQDEVSDLLNFNPSQTDTDFTSAQIKKAINRAYGREVNTAWLEGYQKFFHTTKDVTWPSGDTTYTLPDDIEQKSIIRIINVSSTDPGYEILFSENGLSGDIFWKNRNTLQWGTAGPGSNVTMRFEFYSAPVDMVEDDDEPELIPPVYRELLVWGAGIDLRRRADEGSPPEWQKAQYDLRIDYWKSLSRGRPMSDTPVIKTGNPNAELGFVY